MDLLLSDATRRSVAALQANPGGTYLFYGAQGCGKATVASRAASLLATNASDALTLSPEGKSIGIGQIHNFNAQLNLKRVTVKGHRVAVIDDADSLTREAQNALLKILEEPPADTTIILISHARQLLPTILSRCKSIGFSSLADDDIKSYLVNKLQVDPIQAKQICSQGTAIGRAVRLASDPESWLENRANYDKQQKLLSNNLFERVIASSQIIKSSNTMEVLISLAEQIKRQLRRAAAEEDAAQIKVWARRLSLVAWCQRYLEANGNAKFAFDRLALEMGT